MPFKEWRQGVYMKKNFYSRVFFILSIIYIVLVLISNILANRLVQFFNFSFTGAVIFFPIVYVLGDILTEVYGFKKQCFILGMSSVCNILMIICFHIVLNLPYPEIFKDNLSYEIVLGVTPKIFLASLLGFISGGVINSIIVEKMKKNFKSKHLVLRIIVSTIFGEVVDTSIFLMLAFYNVYPFLDLILMVLYQTIFKVTIEVIFIPITFCLIKKVKKLEEKFFCLNEEVLE